MATYYASIKKQSGCLSVEDVLCHLYDNFQTVIPCHYASFKGYVADDASAFLKAMGADAGRVKVLAAGDSCDA